ncbi:MAG: UvrD-helicase domain-containing protein, partial [Solirubrobacterales bacterium]|nr:UvrD-helicase domain-containing protein [Solirubrobacterales bacterium]
MSVTALGDQRARERIAHDLDANLCVEAAAGTGKTTVLVERVTSLLASGRASAQELVVITFTEKAAAELSSRVRDALERRAADCAGEERERLLGAARELHLAHIETIHSFAAALLRERPVEAGIDLLFEVLDELPAELGFERAYERFQDELLSQPRPELELALRRGFGLAELREACEHLHTYRYLLPLAHAQSAGRPLEAVIEVLGRIADELREMLLQHQPGEDRAVPHVEGIIEWVGELQALSPSEQERHLLFHRAAATHLGRGTDANWAGEKRRMIDLQREYRDTVERAGIELRSDALLGVLPHIERFVADYAEERKRAGRADFDDLLFWARDLLGYSEAARGYFRRRFRAVLIDEFQDTDPVQAELALLLTSDEEPGDDWYELRPGRGRLTAVGDPKQSIYRFRRADMALYDRVKHGALAEGVEEISSNFRSNRQLLTALNAAFDRILIAEREVQPGNVAFAHPPGCAEAMRAPIVLAEGSAKGNADAIRAEEARVIAALLQRARAEAWEVRERGAQEHLRACGWGDMTVLLPARTGVEHYEQALAEAGIPYRHEGARDFFRRDEVRDLIWVLAAVDDPTDRVALVGALRSSAFAVSDQELVLHVSDVGHLSYRSPARGPSEPVNAAFEELRDLHALRRSVSLAELVRRGVERTRLVEFALTRRDGEQGAANLLAIVEDARLFAAAGGGGLRPFIRHLRGSMDREAIEIEATIAEEVDDVVRIMTMHGAKGLESPIVALANLGSHLAAPRDPVPRERESSLHFRVGSASAGRHHFATPGYEEAWEAERAQIDAERLRLLYVAATRARDRLLVPCVVGRESAKGLLGELVGALPCDDAALVSVVDADDLAPPAVGEPDDRAIEESEIAAGVEERSAWLLSRQSLREHAAREREIETASSRERARGPLAAEVVTFDAALLVHDEPPIPVGDAVHMVMERVSLPGAGDLQEIVEDVCLEGDIAERIEEVAAMCHACLRSPALQSALATGAWW